MKFKMRKARQVMGVDHDRLCLIMGFHAEKWMQAKRAYCQQTGLFDTEAVLLSAETQERILLVSQIVDVAYKMPRPKSWFIKTQIDFEGRSAHEFMSESGSAGNKNIQKVLDKLNKELNW